MHKYHARGATDVTGFGLTGHANNLLNLVPNLQMTIQALPVFKNIIKIDKQIINFRLAEGRSAETSGGLLVILPAD